MQKFEHKLRTKLHTKSVQSIMTRSHFHQAISPPRHHPKLDNITTYLRKFEIERENLNLAKRIMQCESQHSRMKYAKQWKKNKQFMRVRSNFKPLLEADSPKIYKVQEIPGKGSLVVCIRFQGITSALGQLSHRCSYILRFDLGSHRLIPNNKYFTLDSISNYDCLFYIPLFLKKKAITCRLMRLNQNEIYEVGKFGVQLSKNGTQSAIIRTKGGKQVGGISFSVEIEHSRQNKENKKEKYINIEQDKDIDQKKKYQQDGISRNVSEKNFELTFSGYP